MAENIGSNVSSAEIAKDLNLAEGQMMFPGYNPSHITDFVTVKADGKCIRKRTIDFYVDFAVVGTDLGSAKELLALTGSILQVNPGTLTPTTAITVAGKIIDTLEDLERKRDGKGSQKFHFPVHLLPRKLPTIHCYNAVNWHPADPKRIGGRLH
jgi:hypothetical protein